jgi:ring-1,2-phenylacetyl-CoA epoxidase subunit PaaB
MKSDPIKSLDPRVGRLPQTDNPTKQPLDQFSTFEVFVQPAPGKPFRHEGPVHAPGLEMAYVLAKEAFTRRFTCSSLFVADTHDVHIFAPDEQTLPTDDDVNKAATPISFEVFQLPKRGKQAVQVGTMEAATPQQALTRAHQQCTTTPMPYAFWAIDRRAIRFTSAEEQDFWQTLPDKKFRDAAAYKGGEKLQRFLDTPR